MFDAKLKIKLLAALALLVFILAPQSTRAGCNGGCVSPSCVAPWCDSCAWCSSGGVGDGNGGDEAFGWKYVIPEGYKKGKQKIAIPCVNGKITQNVCLLIPWTQPNIVDEKWPKEQGIAVTVENHGEVVSDARAIVDENANGNDSLIESGPNKSPMDGVSVTSQLISFGGRQYAKICFDFSTRTSTNTCPDENQVMTVSRYEANYVTPEISQDKRSNIFSFSFTTENSSNNLTNDQVAPLAMADTVTFKVTFARYQGDVFRFNRLDGVCGIYQDSVLQRVEPITNGELTVEMPTDAVTNWEFSFDNIGAFILRFEFVDGYLTVYDEMRNDRQTLYFRQPDGIYNLEYWDGDNEIMITGKTVDEDATLMPLPFYKIEE